MNGKSGKWKVESGKRRRCAIAFRSPLSAFRFGLTLIELLITITILATLAGLFLGASNAAMESARASRTKTTISKIHSLLMERLDSYTTRRVDVKKRFVNQLEQAYRNGTMDSKQRGRELAKYRLLARRELMKLEMPDRWSDITGVAIDPNDQNSTPPFEVRYPPQYPGYLDERPSLTLAYLRRFNSLTGTAKEITANQGAECLYLIIMLATGDGEARTRFSRQDIGDTDGDGALEFLDGWGRPIHYLRWPAGFVSESDLMSGDAETDHDPFDFFRRDVAGSTNFTPWLTDPYPAFRLVPLVYSGGPDGDPDLFTAKEMLIDDPYKKYDTGSITARIGTPMRFGPDPNNDIDPEDDGDNWYDNIHNHLQDGR